MQGLQRQDSNEYRCSRLLRCLNRRILLEPAEAPNSRKAACAPPFAGSRHVSMAPLGPPAVARFRVLQRTEPLPGPAPPKGRVALRVEWRMTLPGDPSPCWAGRAGRKIARASADAVVPMA